jgi:hypothetical protein
VASTAEALDELATAYGWQLLAASLAGAVDTGAAADLEHNLGRLRYGFGALRGSEVDGGRLRSQRTRATVRTTTVEGTLHSDQPGGRLTEGGTVGNVEE